MRLTTRRNSRHRAAIAAAIGIVLCALAVADASAQSDQWRRVEHTPVADGLPSKAAAVKNEQGYELRVFMADEARLTAVFSLPPGLRSLDNAGCPTFKVDIYVPDPVYLPKGRCRVEGTEATVEIARVVDGSVESQIMVQLLNGSALDVIYRLHTAGYQFTRFTLKGSKNALLAALPKDTVIVEQE